MKKSIMALLVMLSLIELMVVVAIIGMLAAVAMTAYNNYACEQTPNSVDCADWRERIAQPALITQCSNGYLFTNDGKRVIGSDGHGVRCY